MEDKRVGGIVAAVTLTITLAFLIVAVLFLHTSTQIAAASAERSTDVHAADMAHSLSAYVRRQYAAAESSVLDPDLRAALARERSGASPADVARELTPLLRRLTVAPQGDEEPSLAYVVSAQSRMVYQSDGAYVHLEEYETDPELEALLDGSQRLRDQDQTSGMSVRTVLAGEEQWSVVAIRSLRADATMYGLLGVRVSCANLSGVMREYAGDASQWCAFLSQTGEVVAASSNEAPDGVGAPEAYRAAGGDALLEEARQEPVHVWVGLEGLLPRDQMLYDVSCQDDLGGYLLTVSTAEDVFATMRAQSTTVVLALVVVMVLLLLLVMFIVRWYRGRLIAAATTDELTGLSNRKSFSSRFAEDGERRAAGDSSLVLIDVDKFKKINDTYGHAGGDRALAAVAAEIARMARERGYAGRWGGDEFIAVLQLPCTEAEGLVQEMIDRVAACQIEGDIRVSVSVGMCDIERDGTLERAVERADDALYVTKEGGRGFLTVYEEGVTPHMTEDHPVAYEPGDPRTTEPVAQTEAAGRRPEPGENSESLADRVNSLLSHVLDSLLRAVRHMVPFVAGGGILIAIAFLIDAASVDVNALSEEARANFGSITPIAAGLKDVGAAAFNFMLPIFAAFFAKALAGDEAFMAGFAGGFLSSQGSAGFAGAIASAVVAAIVVSLMRGFMRETLTSLQRVAPVMVYPVFSLLIMYLLMTLVIDPAATAFDDALTSMLRNLESGNRTVLCSMAAAMMATDMGGPINKAAYHFGTAAIASGSSDIMASVMVGGMVPPCGIALCMLVFRNRFVEQEREQGLATLFMGLSFITEGAIPYVLTDFARVVPSCMMGAGVAGALSQVMGCMLIAPHGGIFVFPVVERAPEYLYALVVGSAVTALVLGLLKRPVAGSKTG